MYHEYPDRPRPQSHDYPDRPRPQSHDYPDRPRPQSHDYPDRPRPQSHDYPVLLQITLTNLISVDERLLYRPHPEDPEL